MALRWRYRGVTDVTAEIPADFLKSVEWAASHPSYIQAYKGAHNCSQVGVGIAIARDPLHGSGQAGFPHPALALGDNAHAPQRIGMTDRKQRQPASDQAPHAIPKNAAVLAPPRQRAMPIPADSEPKNRQRRLVHGHSVVAKVSTPHNRP